MIEWDAKVPAFGELVRELDRAAHWARLALNESRGRGEAYHAA
jgi:hypothetical protein